MTINEASAKYNIPLKILKEYERWERCSETEKTKGIRQYDDHDIERLSMIMTLHEAGFSAKEVESYMRLTLEEEASAQERIRMLSQKRDGALSEIHLKEMQLSRLDYLRHEIKKSINHTDRRS